MNQALHRVSSGTNPHCFACGTSNAFGLRLDFELEAGTAQAEWRPGDAWESFCGVIHGGIVSTVLDEAMSQAVIGQGWNARTAELRVRLRSWVSPGERLRVCGWVTQQRKREIQTEAKLLDERGHERAHAWGKFLIVQP